MGLIIEFLNKYYNSTVMIMFFISAFFLLYYDQKENNRDNYKREAKYAKYAGYSYIVGSIGLYAIVNLIK